MKCKGSSAKKPEIETYIDLFQQFEKLNCASMSTTQSQTSVSQTTSHQSLLSIEDTSPFFSQEESPFVAQDISYENQSPLTCQGTHSFISQGTSPTPALQAVGTQISSPFAYQINNSFHLPK